jgi:hypothetical protein
MLGERVRERERINWVCVSSLGMLGEKEWEKAMERKRGVRSEGSKRVREIMNGSPARLFT